MVESTFSGIIFHLHPPRQTFFPIESNTFTAQSQLLPGTVHQHAFFVQIGLPDFAGAVFGMGNVVADLDAFVTAVTGFETWHMGVFYTVLIEKGIGEYNSFEDR